MSDGVLKWIYGLNLVTGFLPLLALGFGALALAYLLIRRSRRWWIFCFLTAIVSALLSVALGWAAIYLWYWFPEELPTTVIVCVGFALWGLVLGLTTALLGLVGQVRANSGMRHGKPKKSPKASALRRLLALSATAVIVAVSALQINVYFGEYPTVGSLVQGAPGLAQGIPPYLKKKDKVRFQTAALAESWSPPKGMQTNGGFRLVSIPGVKSGFHARSAIVYLPPAYFSTKHPALPVLVLLSGQPGAPGDWLQSGHLGATLEAYAQAHNGLAPVVVMPDPNGSQENNTMCMNSELGQVDTYMAVDVPEWITKTLNVDTNHQHWAVAGFSYGGTCALQMVTRHPEIYRSFAAISPEQEPALTADRAVTIQRAFNGNTAAFDAVVPKTLLAERKYPEIHGWFASGAEDPLYTKNVAVLYAAGKKAGMTLSQTTFPGGHSWVMVSAAFPFALNFLSEELGLQ